MLIWFTFPFQLENVMLDEDCNVVIIGMVLFTSLNCFFAHSSYIL